MKRRIIVYSVFLGVLTILTCFGLFNLILKTKYTNNEITFRVKNDLAFFEANARYYYGDVADPTQIYSAKYTQEDLYNGKYKDEDTTIEPWDIGESVFINDETNPENNKKVLKYVITISNKNRERNLSIKLGNVAYQNDRLFLTEIKYDNVIVFSNGETIINQDNMFTTSNNSVSANGEKVIGIDASFTVEITLTLNTRTKPIRNAENNINFTLESVEI